MCPIMLKTLRHSFMPQPRIQADELPWGPYKSFDMTKGKCWNGDDDDYVYHWLWRRNFHNQITFSSVSLIVIIQINSAFFNHFYVEYSKNGVSCSWSPTHSSNCNPQSLLQLLRWWVLERSKTRIHLWVHSLLVEVKEELREIELFWWSLINEMPLHSLDCRLIETSTFSPLYFVFARAPRRCSSSGSSLNRLTKSFVCSFRLLHDFHLH